MTSAQVQGKVIKSVILDDDTLDTVIKFDSGDLFVIDCEGEWGYYENEGEYRDTIDEPENDGQDDETNGPREED